MEKVNNIFTIDAEFADGFDEVPLSEDSQINHLRFQVFDGKPG
jgi:hypothetical protein